MTTPEKDKHLDDMIRQARPQDMHVPDFQQWSQTHRPDLAALQTQTRRVMPKPHRIMRVAQVAAVVLVLLGVGFISGRLSQKSAVDSEQFRTDLEATLRQQVIAPMQQQWQATLTASCDQLQTEVLTQLRQDMGTLASQTLAASRAGTERQLAELVQHLELIRMQDQQRIVAALEQVENNRRRDTAALGSGLQTLVARTMQSQMN